jgi:Poly A polymerase head domain
MTGHDIDGNAVILNDFGNGTTKSFEEIRLCDPFDRVGPNWMTLPAAGKIVRPDTSTSTQLNTLLARRIPPGPSYRDLIEEIWSRGFEAYIVGGTVRDALNGGVGNDVDVVTTMPLTYALKFLPSMYRYDPSLSRERGYISIGGSKRSGDPHIDLKLFSDSLLGTKEAIFGVGFERDVRHRDFSCNAVYYEPINNVLIDPTGQGISDSKDKLLSFICGSANHHQYAQIFIRAIKFVARGYRLTPETKARVTTDLAAALPSMRLQIRSRYIKAQVLGNCSSPDQFPHVMQTYRECMVSLGLSYVWDTHFEPLLGGLLNDRPPTLEA